MTQDSETSFKLRKLLVSCFEVSSQTYAGIGHNFVKCDVIFCWQILPQRKGGTYVYPLFTNLDTRISPFISDWVKNQIVISSPAMLVNRHITNIATHGR